MSKTAHVDGVSAGWQDQDVSLFASIEDMIAIYENQYNVYRVNIVNSNGHMVAYITYTED